MGKHTTNTRLFSPATLLCAAGLLALLGTLPAIAGPDDRPSPLVRPPAGASGTTFVPDHFLRRWDPVTVFFNRDVGPRDGGPEDHPERYIKASEDHPGAYTWLDARTLQFRPAEPWPALSRFTFKADGQAVTLTTLMAAPLKTFPRAGAEGLASVETLSLTFPEPLDPAALAQMLQIELRPLPGIGSGESRWLTGDDYEVKQNERDSRQAPASYQITLDTPVDRGVRVTLHLRLSLDDDSPESFYEVSFSTTEPFRITHVGCGRSRYPVTPEGTTYSVDQAISCPASSRNVTVDFSAAPRALGPVEGRNLVRFTPSVEDLEFNLRGSTLYVSGSFAWETPYQVTVTPTPISDRAGRNLDMSGESQVSLYFQRRPSYLRWSSSGGIMEQYGSKQVPIEGRGDERLDLRIYDIDPLDRSYWPFPDSALAINESQRPPGPGEELAPFTHGGSISQGDLQAHLAYLGTRSPPVSTIVDLPLRREGSSASFGLDLAEHLAHITGKDRPGTYLVGIRRLDGSTERSWIRVQVTNLCLTTVEEARSVEFRVTSLSSGKPVAGARVRVQGTRNGGWTTLMEGTTDGTGGIHWDAPGRRPDVSWTIQRIVVEKGADTLVLDTTRPPQRYADNHWTRGSETWLQWTVQSLAGRGPQAQTLVHLFTERPVYRPEEEVHIQGYIRKRAEGELEPIAMEGDLVVQSPGDLQWRYPLEVSKSGTFYHHFQEENLTTGQYTAYIETDQHTTYGHTNFLVEAYVIPRFEVQLHSPTSVPLDGEFDVKLTAKYYAGGRVAGRPIQWRVTQYPYTWAPEQRKGFFYSSDGRYSRSGRFNSTPRLEKTSTTDEKGSDRLTLNPSIEPTAQPRSYVVEATVTGADDQTVTAVKRVHALPPFVLGVKVERFLEEAEAIQPEIIVVGHDGKPIAGKEVTVRLLLRQWHSHLRASDFSSGEARYTTDVVDEPVFETTVTSAGEPVTARLPIDRAGVYIVELEARDRLDRTQVVAVDLYAGGDEPVTWSKPVSHVFTVSTDKSSYEPGETAKIVLQSPFQKADVLAVVEAPDGNRYEWLKVRNGAATFRMPVGKTHVPRLPVHFVLMRGRVPGSEPLPGNRTDLGKPQTMAATAWVKVEPVANQVKVDLEYPDSARPGQLIDVKIRLSKPDGTPVSGEVALWLVDQAVLSLGKEQRLDPLPSFITPVYSHLWTRDTRNLVFGYLPFAEQPGGDEGDEEEGDLLDRATVRKNFKPVPYYNPTIVVGKDGVVTVKVQLPDNLTNFKLRAKAISGPDRFGIGVGHLPVRLPLIVQPALPRFVRPGDRFTASAVGRVVEGKGGPGSAQIRAEGVTLEGGDKQTITWAPDTARRLDFPVVIPTPPYTATGALSREEVTFRIGVERKSDGASDAFEVKLPIYDDRTLVRSRLLVDLESGVPVELPEPSEAIRPGTLRRSVLVSTQPGLIKMAAGLSFFMDYPYGCTEQRVSRARAHLAMGKFRDVLAQEGADERLDRVVRETLDWLPDAVDGGGRMATWPGGKGSVYLTAWTLQFLVEAKEAGYAVDPGMEATLKRTLKQGLRSDYRYFIDGEQWAERTWALSALASANEFDSAYAAELSRNSQYLGLESTSMVLLSFSRADDPPASTTDALAGKLHDGTIYRLYQGDEIYGGLQHRRSSRNKLIMPSETRTLAMMTRSLARHGDDNPRLQVLVDALVTLGRDDGWGTTNANAAALLALSDVLSPPFAGMAPASVKVGVGSDNQTLELGPDAAVGSMVSTAAGAGSAVLTENGGDRPVVLRVEMRYLPEADGSHVEPASHGFVTTRELLRVRGGNAPADRILLEQGGTTVDLAVGDVIEEHIQVINPEDRHYIAVTVPLAAGMEPLNPNLATAPPEATPSGSMTRQPAYVSFLDDHVAFYYDTLPKGTYDFYFRLRATTPGQFIQPPAHTEMMYDDTVFGHSPGAKLVIVREEE